MVLTYGGGVGARVNRERHQEDVLGVESRLHFDLDVGVTRL